MSHTLYRYKFDYMCATRPVHATGRPPERPATTTHGPTTLKRATTLAAQSILQV